MITFDQYKMGVIGPNDLDSVWNTVKPLLQMALVSIGDMTAECIKNEIAENRNQLWVVTNEDEWCVCAFVTQTLTYSDSKKVTVINYLGGEDFHLWGQGLLTELESTLKEQGVSALRIIGRKGWERLLMGYSHNSTIIEKEL